MVLDKGLYYANTVGYFPHDGQREIHFAASRFKVVSNGRRWGKTIFGGRECEPNAFVPCQITGKPQLGWIVGPQYTDSEKEFRVVYDSLRRLGVDKSSIKFLNNVDSGSMHIKTNWGFELIGKSAKHPESLVGEGLNFVLMVEAGRHKRRTWGQYIRPALSDRRGWAVFSGVPEGKSQNSLLYALYQRGQDPKFTQWRSWKKPSWTNNIVFPGGRRDPEILEAESDLTSDEFDRQYGAEFRDKTGVVMKEYEDETHLGDFAYRPDWPLFLAIDYGFTNRFVVLFVQLGPNGEIRVIDEICRTGIDSEEMSELLLRDKAALIERASRIYADPANPNDTRTMERKLRITAYGGTGGPLDIRLRLIRRALKVKSVTRFDGSIGREPLLKIDRKCTYLSWEMREGYRWPEFRSEVKSDSENPLDKDNHSCEALGRFFRGYYRSLDNENGSSQSTAKIG